MLRFDLQVTEADREAAVARAAVARAALTESLASPRGVRRRAEREPPRFGAGEIADTVWVSTAVGGNL
jgi:hypothetical protein